jgi:hypothetical protein
MTSAVTSAVTGWLATGSCGVPGCRWLEQVLAVVLADDGRVLTVAAEADQKIASTLDQRIGSTRNEPSAGARDHV